MKILITLLSLLTIYSCGKSNSGDSIPVGNIVNDNDPCKTSSLCSQEKQVRTIDDLRIIERDSRGNRVDESYTIGYTLQETAIFLNNEYDWETNTFSGDCVEASDTIKTVYKINYNQVDEDGEKYDEFITKVSEINRRLITQTEKCIEDFNNSDINTTPRFESDSVYHKNWDFSQISQDEINRALEVNNISILKFNGKWALKLSNKDLNNFMIRKFRWIDSTNDFEEIEIKTYGQTSIITYIQSSLGTPVFFTKAFLGEQLVSYRNRFFVKSWLENVDPSEVPQGM